MKRVSLPRDGWTRFQNVFLFSSLLSRQGQVKVNNTAKEIHWRNGNQDAFWQGWWFSIIIIGCVTINFRDHPRKAL